MTRGSNISIRNDRNISSSNLLAILSERLFVKFLFSTVASIVFKMRHDLNGRDSIEPSRIRKIKNDKIISAEKRLALRSWRSGSHVTAPVLVAFASADWPEIIPNGDNHVRCGEIVSVRRESVDIGGISVVVCLQCEIGRKS